MSTSQIQAATGQHVLTINAAVLCAKNAPWQCAMTHVWLREIHGTNVIVQQLANAVHALQKTKLRAPGAKQSNDHRCKPQ
jgi:hypothetical protein